MKTEIFLVRHGNVHNPHNVLYGRLKRFSLSIKGREEIRMQAEKLSDKNIDVIISSPLLRARQTAYILSRFLKVPVKYSSLLIEVRIIHQGLPLKEFKERLQEDMYSSENISKGQESIEEIRKRMEKFLLKTVLKYKGKKVAVVSHGDPIVITKAWVEKKEFSWKYKRNNYINTGECTQILFDNNKYSIIKK